MTDDQQQALKEALQTIFANIATSDADNFLVCGFRVVDDKVLLDRITGSFPIVEKAEQCIELFSENLQAERKRCDLEDTRPKPAGEIKKIAPALFD